MELEQTLEARERFVEAWNVTMVSIWEERIHKLGVVDTGELYRSLKEVTVTHDADFLNFKKEGAFAEHGIWQDLGVGRGVAHGNDGKSGKVNMREPRRWFSIKYYSSVLALRDFMARSIGEEFKGMVFDALDAKAARASTAYYKDRGWS